MKTAQPQKLVNVREMCEILGISDRTLQKLYKHGGMPHLRVGNSVRFNSTRVIEWLEQRPKGKESEISP